MKEKIALFMQVSLTFIIVIFCIMQLNNDKVGEESKVFYGSLLSASIARWMPTPGERKQEDTQYNIDSTVDNRKDI